jgi:hypothetical protein
MQPARDRDDIRQCDVALASLNTPRSCDVRLPIPRTSPARVPSCRGTEPFTGSKGLPSKNFMTEFLSGAYTGLLVNWERVPSFPLARLCNGH